MKAVYQIVYGTFEDVSIDFSVCNRALATFAEEVPLADARVEGAVMRLGDEPDNAPAGPNVAQATKVAMSAPHLFEVSQSSRSRFDM